MVIEVVEAVEVVEERAGARKRLVSETAMVHGVGVLVPPPITHSAAAPGGRAATVHAPRSEQDLRIPEIIDVACGHLGGGGGVGGLSGPVDVDALARPRIGCLAVCRSNWGQPWAKKQRHGPSLLLLQAAAPLGPPSQPPEPPFPLPGSALPDLNAQTKTASVSPSGR